MAYNPNRDSGIAEARSYVEIDKDKLTAEQVEEFEFSPTRRYFAQLVYNVGPTTSIGGGGQFTDGQIEKLTALLEKADVLLGLATTCIETHIIKLNLAEPETASLTDEKTIIAVQLETDSNTYSIVQDTNNIDLDDNTEFLLNIPGYVCGIECYTWIDANNVSQVTERFIPKMTYLPHKEDDENDTTTPEELKTGNYPNGKTIIYLSANEFKDLSELPDKYRILKIHTLKTTSNDII